jgi:hypothetical protein
MKATLTIKGDKKVKFDFDNLTLSQFRMIGSRPSEICPMIVEKYPIGEPITLITSNMPEVLKNEIVELIERYCNH